MYIICARLNNPAPKNTPNEICEVAIIIAMPDWKTFPHDYACLQCPETIDFRVRDLSRHVGRIRIIP